MTERAQPLFASTVKQALRLSDPPRCGCMIRIEGGRWRSFAQSSRSRAGYSDALVRAAVRLQFRGRVFYAAHHAAALSAHSARPTCSAALAALDTVAAW